MKGYFLSMLHNIPWPFLIVKDLPKDKIRVQRILEGLVIAVLSSAITIAGGGYVLINILDTKMSFYAEQIKANSNELHELRRDLYRPRFRNGPPS